MRTIYDLMGESVDTDSYGETYPDIMTLDTLTFNYTNPATKYVLTERDIFRFDQLILNYYGSVSYYMSMILILNDIDFLTTYYTGTSIYLPLKEDLDTYYLENVT